MVRGTHPAERLRELIATPGMFEVAAAYDCVTARLAEQAGFDGILIGGGAIANFGYGLPDVGLVSLPELLQSVQRIAASVHVPVITDIDDGGATAIHIRRTVSLAERAGAAGVMFEDVNSAYPKHLWIEERQTWDLGDAVLYPAGIGPGTGACGCRGSREQLLRDHGSYRRPP